MNSSSGIKRGLATVAVSALAVSGLAGFAGTAHAETLTPANGTTVVLHTQSTSVASTANDGANTTVHLLATAGSKVTKVRFTYKVGAAAEQVIVDNVVRSNGAFSAEWNVPSNILGANNVTIAAVGFDAAGDVVDTAGQASVEVTAAKAATNISSTGSAPVGVFKSVYSDNAPGFPQNAEIAAVTGTTGDSSIPGAVYADASVLGGSINGTTDFAAPVEVTGYGWDTPAVGDNEKVLSVGGVSGDSVAATLYKQEIKGITATPEKTSVPNGTGTNVVTKVVDQNGKPVVGAEVVQTVLGPPVTTTFMTTNAKGEATFPTGNITSGAPFAAQYHVNTTDADAYDATVDFKDDVTVSAYAQTLTSLEVKPTATSKTAFDLNETGQKFQVAGKDQNGANAPLPANLNYKWTVTPFVASDAAHLPAGIQDNKAVPAGGEIDFPTTTVSGNYVLTVWNEKDGNTTPSAGDIIAENLTVKAGQAAIKWDATNATVVASAGTDVTVDGKIALEDGTVLAGRTAVVTLTPGSPAGDAAIAAGQPTGTVRNSATQATATTKADGSFSVKVTDPAVAAGSPQPSELNVKLSATAATLAAGPSVVEIDFQKVDVDSITLSDADVFNEAAPGKPVKVTGVLKNADGQALANVATNLTLDKGFFVQTDASTSGDAALKGLVPDPAQAEGGLWGEWASAGATKTVVTNAQGEFEVVVGIERDEDFDDDGKANVKVAAEAGAKTKDLSVEFTSDNAINVSDVNLSYAEDQDSTILDKARTGQDVNLDVAVLDQFGNRAKQSVAIASAGVGTTTGTPVQSNYTNDTDGAITLNSAAAGVQTVSVKFTGTSTVWKDQTPDPAPSRTWVIDNPALTKSSDDVATTWYVVDLEASSYTLSHNGEEWNQVGKVVTVTFEAKDQEGQALPGVLTQFFRSGPDDLQDGSGNTGTATGANGKVTYTFQGAKAGTAVVSTVGKVGGAAIEAAQQEISIKFGTEPVEPTEPSAVTAKLAGEHNGAKKDKLKVTTSPAAKGAVVTLQRLNAKGKWTAVDSKVINKKGKKSFKVADLNGKKKTAYRVVVKATATTKAATSNTKKVK